MHVTIARAAGVLLTALLATPLMAAAQTAPAQSAERSRTQGIKETDRFIKAGNNAHASIANARLEAKNTLDRYNKLVTQPSKNMKGDYKKLMGAVDDMNEEIADARLEITNMRANGDTYFTGRETTNKAIQDQQLQSTATTRLATSRKDFDTVLASLRAAGGRPRGVPEGSRRPDHVPGQRLDPDGDDRVEAGRRQAEQPGR